LCIILRVNIALIGILYWWHCISEICGNLRYSYYSFKRIVSEYLFTFEELNTFVIEVKGILHSRSIITISIDSNDLLASAHYLIYFLQKKTYYLLWQTNYLFGSISRRYVRIFDHNGTLNLNELQTRSKWTKNQSSVWLSL